MYVLILPNKYHQNYVFSSLVFVILVLFFLKQRAKIKFSYLPSLKMLGLLNMALEDCFKFYFQYV